MSLANLLPEKLKIAEKLMYQAKFDDALKIISNLEKIAINNSEEQLLILILKGKINFYRMNYKESFEIGEIAYNLSEELDLIPNSIDALLLKSLKVYLGESDPAIIHISEAERLLKSISNNPPPEFSKLEAFFLLIKAVVFRFSADQNKGLELTFQWLELYQTSMNKLDIAIAYYQIGDIHIYKSEPSIALSYAMKSLALQKELKNNIGIASCLQLIGLCHYSKGEFDQALKISKQCLAVDEISIGTKLSNLHLLGAIYKEKGELNRTLRYYNRAAKLAEKESYLESMLENLLGIGSTFRMKGDFDKATEYLQRTFTLSKEQNSPYGITSSLFYLILTSLDKNSLDLAKQYLNQLEQFVAQNENIFFSQLYSITKALVLKNSGRIRNRTEAELLLKKIIEKGINTPQLALLSIVNLCDLFLEELAITNNKDVLIEINPLINQILKVAEEQNAYLWLAEIKLLQAKLALIQMKIKDAETLFTHAQQIAEIHGLDLLAMKISSEHDNLLDQLNLWNNLEKENAPLSERIKLASFESVINRMQGKGALDPPKLVHEIPILLLIIGEGGFPLLSKVFTKGWPFEGDLISGFLSAFDSFSGELFAKRLDRAKFGDYTLLMQSTHKFSFCYLFKGQSYLAKQKLNRLIDRIQNLNQIWEIFNNYFKANRVMELKNHPSIKSIINDIFIRENPKISE